MLRYNGLEKYFFDDKCKHTFCIFYNKLMTSSGNLEINVFNTFDLLTLASVLGKLERLKKSHLTKKVTVFRQRIQQHSSIDAQ